MVCLQVNVLEELGFYRTSAGEEAPLVIDQSQYVTTDQALEKSDLANWTSSEVKVAVQLFSWRWKAHRKVGNTWQVYNEKWKFGT